MSLKYRLLNALFHAAHLVLIAFLASGWAFQASRLPHLGALCVTFGLWKLTGGCPLTVWHWGLKRSSRQKVPRGPYIHFLLEHLSGKKLDPKKLDRWVVRATLGIVLLSLGLNLYFEF